MIFEKIKTNGLAHFSYLLGDDDEGVCAVIDPRRDVDVYLELARQHKTRIALILETHIHADYVSGSRELAAITGAPIGVGATGEYGFEHRPLAGGEALELGNLKLKVLHTPGHTPEHVCFLVSGGSGSPEPWGLFTGDTLFAGEVGRPDLLGKGTEDALTRQLFHSLHDKLLKLGDEIIIYPAHGQGSPCGAHIGDRPASTIGYERQHNRALQAQSEDKFVRQVLDSLSPAPTYYAHLKKVNSQGPAVLGRWPYLQPLDAGQFQAEMGKSNTVVVDAREIEAFGGAYIAGAVNIALRDIFPIWVGRVLDPEKRLLLVLPDEDKVDIAQRHLLRIGYENVVGYLRQGMRGWFQAGLPFERLPQMSIQELRARIEARTELQVLDVRSNEEWEEGHIPTARHIFVPELLGNVDHLARQKPLAVYCGSGYRASIAASLLRQHGLQKVYNVPGSITAWKAANYPLEGMTDQA